MSAGGRVGGNRTKEKYSSSYFTAIGRRGGRPRLPTLEELTKPMNHNGHIDIMKAPVEQLEKAFKERFKNG